MFVGKQLSFQLSQLKYWFSTQHRLLCILCILSILLLIFFCKRRYYECTCKLYKHSWELYIWVCMYIEWGCMENTCLEYAFEMKAMGVE